MGASLAELATNHSSTARLYEISDGDPLVVGLYVGYLRDNPAPPTRWPSSTRPVATLATLGWLAQAQPGLEGFIEKWWQDQARLKGRSRVSGDARRVFDLICTAFGPLERRTLLELARRDRALSGTIWMKRWILSIAW